MATTTTEALRASLKAHNDSFDALLRRIPAAYYIRRDDNDDDGNADSLIKHSGPLTKAQKKALRKQKQDPAFQQAKSLALKQARLAKYDPDEPKTIPEIQQARQNAKLQAEEQESNDEGASWQDVDSEDDDGQAEFAQNDDEEAEDSPNDTDFVDSDEEDISVPKLHHPSENKGPSPSVTELRERLRKRIQDIQAAKKSVGSKKRGGADEDADDDDVNEDEETAQVKSKEDLLEERRRRGALRDNRRKKRKEERKHEALTKPKRTENQPSNGRKGGGKANAAGFNGSDDEADRPRKKTKNGDGKALVLGGAASASSSALVPSEPVDPEAFTFSNLDFAHQSLLNANSTMSPKALSKLSNKKNRHALPKDPNAALQVLAARKQKLSEMTDEQREKREDKDRWEKVELKAQGDKVRDDEKRLKKMAKRQEQIKRKSAKAWAERKQQVQTNISTRIEKRNANIQARIQAQKDKKSGIKNKSSSKTGKPGSGGKTKSSSHSHRPKAGGRPGFEGKGKPKSKK
ncbi:hypothetical protein OIV83_006002 [Microbotryomycetes sp. JL201]|nr:hypothetical protein OIV83_006002 [Microbotryomycetes sp. JL201]